MASKGGSITTTGRGNTLLNLGWEERNSPSGDQPDLEMPPRQLQNSAAENKVGLLKIKEDTSLKKLCKYQNICGMTMIQKDENRLYHQINPEIQAKEKTKSQL
ncbi:hypothetical protein AV530_004265 [Patagioenas fasciata monilis]|uniref:Uncharacterized protein n=1 Tax=Patagioenas fasciata monilis TaxID=372326 RepID=A0A1V4K8Z1_PATFA|nr:hypothetical protein AV530_004265 [Patagioenas fasciata monilis]